MTRIHGFSSSKIETFVTKSKTEKHYILKNIKVFFKRLGHALKHREIITDRKLADWAIQKIEDDNNNPVHPLKMSSYTKIKHVCEKILPRVKNNAALQARYNQAVIQHDQESSSESSTSEEPDTDESSSESESSSSESEKPSQPQIPATHISKSDTITNPVSDEESESSTSEEPDADESESSSSESEVPQSKTPSLHGSKESDLSSSSDSSRTDSDVDIDVMVFDLYPPDSLNEELDKDKTLTEEDRTDSADTNDDDLGEDLSKSGDLESDSDLLKEEDLSNEADRNEEDVDSGNGEGKSEKEENRSTSSKNNLKLPDPSTILPRRIRKPRVELSPYAFKSTSVPIEVTLGNISKAEKDNAEKTREHLGDFEFQFPELKDVNVNDLKAVLDAFTQSDNEMTIEQAQLIYAVMRGLLPSRDPKVYASIMRLEEKLVSFIERHTPSDLESSWTFINQLEDYQVKCLFRLDNEIEHAFKRNMVLTGQFQKTRTSIRPKLIPLLKYEDYEIPEESFLKRMNNAEIPVLLPNPPRNMEDPVITWDSGASSDSVKTEVDSDITDGDVSQELKDSVSIDWLNDSSSSLDEDSDVGQSKQPYVYNKDIDGIDAYELMQREEGVTFPRWKAAHIDKDKKGKGKEKANDVSESGDSSIAPSRQADIGKEIEHSRDEIEVQPDQESMFRAIQYLSGDEVDDDTVVASSTIIAKQIKLGLPIDEQDARIVLNRLREVQGHVENAIDRMYVDLEKSTNDEAVGNLDEALIRITELESYFSAQVIESGFEEIGLSDSINLPNNTQDTRTILSSVSDTVSALTNRAMTAVGYLGEPASAVVRNANEFDEEAVNRVKASKYEALLGTLKRSFRDIHLVDAPTPTDKIVREKLQPVLEAISVIDNPASSLDYLTRVRDAFEYDTLNGMRDVILFCEEHPEEITPEFGKRVYKAAYDLYTSNDMSLENQNLLRMITEYEGAKPYEEREIPPGESEYELFKVLNHISKTIDGAPSKLTTSVANRVGRSLKDYFAFRFSPIGAGNPPQPMDALTLQRDGGLAPQQVRILGMGSPTLQAGITTITRENAEIDPLFIAAQKYMEIIGESSLYVSLQDATSAEKRRNTPIMDVQNELKSFHAITLSKNTHFYEGRHGKIDKGHGPSDKKEFEAELQKQIFEYSKEKSGCFISKKIKRKIKEKTGESLEKTSQKMIRKISKSFFESKTELTEEERKVFIELYYNLMVGYIVTTLDINNLNFTCKDGIDRGMGALGWFMFMFMVINEKENDPKAVEALKNTLYTRAYWTRKRNIVSSREKRFFSDAEWLLNETKSKEGRQKFVDLVKKFMPGITETELQSVA